MAEEKASLSSYFQQTQSSAFDQLSQAETQGSSSDLFSSQLSQNTSTKTEDNTANMSTDEKAGVDPTYSSGQFSVEEQNAKSSFQNVGYENPAYTQEVQATEHKLNANNAQIGSPQPAVLTPGVTQPNSQASTPFKEIDSTQAALLSSQKNSTILPIENVGLSPQKAEEAPKSKETSPNTSVDVESTIVKFSQSSLTDPSEIECVPVTAQQISVPPKSLPTSAQFSNTSDNKISKYFSGSKSSFEASRLINQSNTSLSDSAMMNPVYMSPTDNFIISAAIPSPDSFLTPATEQDVFTASLLSSDADRRHDAWIPSNSTKKALLTMSSSPPGTYFPEKELLTMPGIAVKEDFVSKYLIFPFTNVLMLP